MPILQAELTELYEGAFLGILIVKDIHNMPSHPDLDEQKQNLQKHLADTYGALSRKDLKETHPMDAYIAYYKSFGYSYHVLPQLESAIKGKPIPSISAVVTAMFMAELKNAMLTAGHDADKLCFPLVWTKSTGRETFVCLNGKEVTNVEGDMMVCDREGVISSILRGPDQRTCVDLATKNALFCIYAPQGVGSDPVNRHMEDIETYISVFSPGCTTSHRHVYTV